MLYQLTCCGHRLPLTKDSISSAFTVALLTIAINGSAFGAAKKCYEFADHPIAVPTASLTV